MIWQRSARAGAATVLILTTVMLSSGLPAEGRTLPRPRSSRGAALFVSHSRARALVDHYARLHGVPRHIAHNLVQAESGWRQNAVSRRGARGLMQLMPATARWLGVNAHSTEQNIEGGLRYLAMLYRKFGRWDLALAAYNTGPARVKRLGRVPPWTRAYVERILSRS